MAGLAALGALAATITAANAGRHSAQAAADAAKAREAGEQGLRQTEALRDLASGMSSRLEALERHNGEAHTRLSLEMEQKLAELRAATEQRLGDLRSMTERRLHSIQEHSGQKLDEIKGIVDEKLQKTLEERIGQSFARVSEQLEQVYKGLGEMQGLAAGVGDLKKVLGGVKTRGILGEIQLGAILEQILSPEQYGQNVAVNPHSSLRVEYAVKMPGGGGDGVWLPIDAKFPYDRYHALCEAYDSGDAALIDAAAKELTVMIRTSAKDIRDKYIQPPYTTDFAILFLPFEGLYAEVVRRGMVELLQREYKVNIAGPTTMGALLSSLRLGFRSLAIQKRSGEVWGLLGSVKNEFEKFADALAKTQNRINAAGADLEGLVGTRTRSILRSLRSVESAEQLTTSGEPLAVMGETGEDE